MTALRPFDWRQMADVHHSMLSVEAALDLLLGAVGDPLPAEQIPLDGALGRILATPVRSAIYLPPWDNSAMDGYAVHAADTAGATTVSPVRLRVVGEVRAGASAAIAVPAGCAVRIATGAPFPSDADAVVQVENTIEDAVSADEGGTGGPVTAEAFRPGSTPAATCLIAVPARVGDNVRRRGDDVRAGDELLAAGTRLGPTQIALAAAVGRAAVEVHRRPAVAVLATGDELRAAGADLGAAGIPDANRPGLLAACVAAGAETVDLGIAGDSLDSILAALRPALDRVDAIIVSGGVSVGPYDHVRAAFESVGSMELWRVAIQPGKPFAFGRSHSTAHNGRRVLLFGLPGNPVSTFVTFELFVKPAIRRLAGGPRSGGSTDVGVSRDPMKSSQGRRGYVRVRAERRPNGSIVRDTRGRVPVTLSGAQGSHVLSAMAAADALAIVPETSGRIEPGDEVEIVWLDD